MSNDVQIPMEDRVRSLERNEAQVLYGRCRGLTHGQIAAKYEKMSDTWSRNLMTRVFEKVGAKKADSRSKKNEFLKTQVCPVLDEILQANEANLERWPLFGWVLVSRDGENAVYREREEHERLYPDVREDVPLPEDIDLMIGNEDEEDELEARVLNGMEEDEEEQEVPSQRSEPVAIPPEIEPTTPPSSAEPQRDFEWRHPPNQPRNRFLFLASAVLCIACIGLVWFAVTRFRGLLTLAPTSAATSTPTNAPTNTPRTPLPTETLPSSPTPAETFTPEASPTPVDTATSEISPTAIPLPIKENFNQQYSDLWRVSGDPFIAQSSQYGWDGSLSTRQGATASLAIGNSAWTDYAVNLRGAWISDPAEMNIGLRVIDLNNMVILSCKYLNCDWIIVYQGQRDVLQTGQYMHIRDNMKITVQGDTFSVVGEGGIDPDTTMSLILPPKYKGKFPGGGVLVEITNMEVDYIEIQPLK